MTKVIITLTNQISDYDISFNLLDSSIAHRWVKHLNLFIQSGQPLDDPKRFYNFANTEYTKIAVIDKLIDLTNIIKNYAPGIITREINDSLTQDDLNYLHHIFEVYHGLYDQQDTNTFFRSAPKDVQDALGDLNIWIHRYETLGGIPRFVATWKYKPYRDKFLDEDFKLFTLSEEWGDLRLNYCEIGKTLFDFWHDDDKHIHPEAFQPHHHYCFDFTVRFTDQDASQFQLTENKIWDYFDDHRDLFNSLGFQKYSPKLSLGGITIAKIIMNGSREEMLKNISEHQCIKHIRLM